MNYFIKKMYFSIFASLLVIITVATTSYAWYSTSQNVGVDEFSIRIYNSDDKESDNLKLSITGEDASWAQDLNESDLEKACLYQKLEQGVLKNTEIDTKQKIDDLSNSDLKKAFNKYVRISAATPSGQNTGQKIDLINGFSTVNLDNPTNYTTTYDYISFDLYISIENEKTYVTDGVTVYLNSYIDSDSNITNKVAEADNFTCSLLTDLPSGGIDALGNTLVKSPMKTFSVNPINAIRMGVDTYNASDKGKNSALEKTKESKVYSLSSQEASNINGVYNFGGLNGDGNGYNAMLEYYNSVKPSENYQDIVPNYIKERNDSYLYSEETDKEIISKSDGLTTQKMIKVRFYFWLEGWDSDCFNALTSAKMNFNIYLSTTKPGSEE